MKTLNLNEYGVAELNTREMRKTDGGVIGILIVAAACLLVGGCATTQVARKSSPKDVETLPGSTTTN